MQKNKPDYYNDLDKVYLKIWDLLKIGLKNRDLPFHIPVFICGNNIKSDGRIVVLRGIDEEQKKNISDSLKNDLNIELDFEKLKNIQNIQIEDIVKRDNSVKAIIPVHYAGEPVNMKFLWDLAEKYGLFILEDAVDSASIFSCETNIFGAIKICSYCSKLVPKSNPVLEDLKPVVAVLSVLDTSRDVDTALPE